MLFSKIGALAGLLTPASEVWTKTLTNAWGTTPQDLYLPAFLADICTGWAPT